MNKKTTQNKVILADGGFEDTKLPEHFKPCIVLFKICIQDENFVQRFWSDVETGIILPILRHILWFCPLKITVL